MEDSRLQESMDADEADPPPVDQPADAESAQDIDGQQESKSRSHEIYILWI